ncbi:hypothetical protein ASPVEDRAFT_81164 [Aspergillus versicolor CBS 583.65]|uniref:Uncharacterized protein n=1 Tax=Aspergillus versicolor CBS 583.65 TaxID=1036611 RepID=A0A1L9PDG7_ASPVE|nr:uncharacterized protein ASPVEDRAFT_81164 [Aspergillus versicolor CBS 583.65]OJI99550.1 hypothetical protein ASPVEDRAFT_81164 [Aspergillus versicolor CBS 583.65]
MQLTIFSQVVYLGLLVCRIHGQQVPAPTDAGVGPVVTAAPEYPAFVDSLDKRQQGEDFVAWWPVYSSWREKTCEPGSQYVTHSTYGQCCATSASECNYATACAPDGSVQYYRGNQSCDPGQYCEVFTILPSSGSPASEKRDIVQCISSGYDYAGTWYRQSYALTTDPSTTTVTQTETAQTTTVTQAVPTDGSTALKTQAMQGALGAFIVAVLLMY